MLHIYPLGGEASTTNPARDAELMSLTKRNLQRLYIYRIILVLMTFISPHQQGHKTWQWQKRLFSPSEPA